MIREVGVVNESDSRGDLRDQQARKDPPAIGLQTGDQDHAAPLAQKQKEARDEQLGEEFSESSYRSSSARSKTDLRKAAGSGDQGGSPQDAAGPRPSSRKASRPARTKASKADSACKNLLKDKDFMRVGGDEGDGLRGRAQADVTGGFRSPAFGDVGTAPGKQQEAEGSRRRATGEVGSAEVAVNLTGARQAAAGPE